MPDRAAEAPGVLESLRLLDFRCFETLSLEVPADGLLLIGGNAQGKTTFPENTHTSFTIY